MSVSCWYLPWHLLFCVALLASTTSCRDASGRKRGSETDVRILSLSPAVTETLLALGLGQQVVAVTDYCHEPAAVEDLPRVGTIFAPRYEAVAAARPTIILA